MIIYLIGIILLMYHFSCMTMNKETITLFYLLRNKPTHVRCCTTGKQCKLIGICDVHYETKKTVDVINEKFNFQIPYNAPFIPIDLDLSESTNDVNRIYLKIDGFYWHLAFGYGIPLPLLEQEVIALGKYRLKKAPQTIIDFTALEQTFAKYPLGHAFCFNYTDRFSQDQHGISHWIKQGIIEKDGDGYKHGPSGYFAQKESEKSLLLKNRINGVVQKNKQYAAITFLVSVLRK
jgi:hypothetical protein